MSNILDLRSSGLQRSRDILSPQFCHSQHTHVVQQAQTGSTPDLLLSLVVIHDCSISNMLFLQQGVAWLLSREVSASLYDYFNPTAFMSPKPVLWDRLLNFSKFVIFGWRHSLAPLWIRASMLLILRKYHSRKVCLNDIDLFLITADSSTPASYFLSLRRGLSV